MGCWRIIGFAIGTIIDNHMHLLMTNAVVQSLSLSFDAADGAAHDVVAGLLGRAYSPCCQHGEAE
jgi:hypothetical protein